MSEMIKMIQQLKPLVVIALGGNAIIRGKQKGTYEEQLENIIETCKQIMKIINKGYRIVITHGNGPQVGSIMLQMEAGSKEPYNRPVLPMDVAGSMTQGQIGYMIQQVLGNLLLTEGPPSRLDPLKKIKPVTIVTQNLVSKNDPAFKDPSKPVGPFLTKNEADKAKKEHPDFFYIEDAGRGYRRVVPSPNPVDIYEKDQINSLLIDGYVLITSGGGGIPVIQNDDGTLTGVEAVIDKDLAGAKLANNVSADVFAILTDAEQVMLDFKGPNERGLDKITVKELEQYLADESFGDKLKGSMGPKLEAARRYIRDGGKKVIITSPGLAVDALDENAGTTIVP
ncbi:MAG: Carbamate kinase [Candidatus Heimdallarchaeota archaeon LC_3]|nr:MAG: Carbamate kinase [Candidatus Heimdallarchaeota archaeon LC_3]